MWDVLGGMSQSAAGMEAQARRLRLSAENVANADTPGYRRKLTDFRTLADGTVAAGPVRLDPRDLQQVHDPGHPLADATGTYRGSNIDLVIEIADAREAQRSYEANMRVFDQLRQMTQSLFDLLRR